MLECPKVFSLFLPDGWSVTGQPGKFYELIPPQGGGALHISVYQRLEAPITKGEALDRMSHLLGNLTVVDTGDIVVLAESDAQHRAVSRSRTLDPENGKEFGFLAFLVLWKSHVLICSCTAEPESALLDEAELLFASIAPIAPFQKRGLRRRQ
jgi:hypothetical protein